MLRGLPILLIFFAIVFWDDLSSMSWLGKPVTYEGEGRASSGDASSSEEAIYGAIAISVKTFAWGSSNNYSNEKDARKDAVRRCAESGATDCDAKTWGSHSCMALAISPRVVNEHSGAWGSARHENVEKAKATALENCSKHAKGCKVVESFCARKDTI